MSALSHYLRCSVICSYARAQSISLMLCEILHIQMSSDFNHYVGRLNVGEKGDAVFIYAHDAAAYLEFELLEAGIYYYRTTRDK